MTQAPIELYYWPTPNGFKITIMLEECGLPYEIKPININKGAQFEPSFLKIAPNNRMPAIIDPAGPGGKPISVFESGAILVGNSVNDELFHEPLAAFRNIERHGDIAWLAPVAIDDARNHHRFGKTIRPV